MWSRLLFCALLLLCLSSVYSYPTRAKLRPTPFPLRYNVTVAPGKTEFQHFTVSIWFEGDPLQSYSFGVNANITCEGAPCRVFLVNYENYRILAQNASAVVPTIAEYVVENGTFTLDYVLPLDDDSTFHSKYNGVFIGFSNLLSAGESPEATLTVTGQGWYLLENSIGVIEYIALRYFQSLAGFIVACVAAGIAILAILLFLLIFIGSLIKNSLQKTKTAIQQAKAENKAMQAGLLEEQQRTTTVYSGTI